MIYTGKIQISTKGNTDIIDITDKVQEKIEKAISNSKQEIKNGFVLLFVNGSTAGLTTIEYEPGLIKDLKEMFENLIPEDKTYSHNEKWHDNNGHSHLRASLLKPSLIIPFSKSKLLLGTWQQITLIDFDNHPRTREIIIQINGE